VIALAKPRQTDYSDPRAYHLIQLLECIGKVLKEIMADRLTFFLNKYAVTPFTQFGAHKGSSTSDAALTFIHDIQNDCNRGLVTTALMIDIKGYFNFVNHKNLLSKIRKAKLPLTIVK
jgi:retron-type reverse transcriptase